MLFNIKHLIHKIMPNKKENIEKAFTVNIIITHNDKYGFKITQQKTVIITKACDPDDGSEVAAFIASDLSDMLTENFDATIPD